MKRFLFLLVLATCLIAGCFETNEVITINEDGSGVYKSSMDMSAMFDFIDKMKESEDASGDDDKNKTEKNIDSVFMMKDFVDTAAGLTEEQKRLMRPAQLHIKMSEKEKKMMIEVTYPYTALADLEKIMQIEKEGKGLAALGKDKSPLPGGDPGDNEGASPFGNLDKIFKYTIKDGLLDRTVNKDSVASIMATQQFQQMEQMTEMLEQVKFNLTLQLPRPAKNVSGSRVKLSADKKKVTMTTSMKDLFTDATAFNYHIEY